MDEILNLDYNRCKLILKSLNTSKTINEAAIKCGLSKKTMITWKKNYNIVKNKDGVYQRNNIPWNTSIL